MNEILRLLDIMVRLRDPTYGCPWDTEQTFASVVPHTLEEAYEVADAIERNDLADLKDELGDLLFQVVFHARMGEEEQVFDFEDVVRGIADKLVRRHPHVFGEAQYETADELHQAWESHKAEERATKRSSDSSVALPSELDGVAQALPALSRALKLQKRAARVGFDWPELGPVMHKFEEELDELREALAESNAAGMQEEIGDLLFTAVNLARHLNVDAELALRKSSAKFEARFRALERHLAKCGKTPRDATLEELEALWDEVKRLRMEKEYSSESS